MVEIRAVLKASPFLGEGHRKPRLHQSVEFRMAGPAPETPPQSSQTRRFAVPTAIPKPRINPASVRSCGGPERQDPVAWLFAGTGRITEG